MIDKLDDYVKKKIFNSFYYFLSFIIILDIQIYLRRNGRNLWYDVNRSSFRWILIKPIKNKPSGRIILEILPYKLHVLFRTTKLFIPKKLSTIIHILQYYPNEFHILKQLLHRWNRNRKYKDLRKLKIHSTLLFLWSCFNIKL